MFDRRLPRHGSRRRRLLLDVGFAAAGALAAAAIAIVALRAWRMDLGVPLTYSGDALLNLGWIQNVVDTGWYLEGPRLGAPFGQEHHDYPLGPDQLHFVLLRGLTLLTGEAPATMNLFYLLGFPLAALTCYWAFRQLGVHAPLAAFGSILFAILPYHFLRGEVHLFLSAYETVPLSCYLIVATAQGHAFFGLRRSGGTPTRRSRVLSVAAPPVLALLIASGGGYYAAFTLALLAVATPIGALRRRSRRVLASGAILAALLVAFLAVNSLPTFQYAMEHGSNPDVPVRDETETERHALRPVTLVLPVVGHRIAPLADLAGRYASFPSPGERGEALGVIGLAGLAMLVVVALGALSGAYARGWRWSRHRVLAALVLIVLLFAVTGGASSLVALLATAQIRAWARLSIFIGFFALLSTCLALGWHWRRARTPRARALVSVGLVLLLGVAALDQTTNGFVPAYSTTAARFAADRAFVQSVEAMLPPGAAIYQLPYRQYPEGGPREDTPDYDPMRGYIHSTALRWSYGAIKGREAGWQPYVHTARAAEWLPLVAAAGFSAVWVDRDAYPDGGRGVEAQLQGILATSPFENPDDRYAIYDIRAFAAAQAARLGPEQATALERELLAPVWLRWGRGIRRGVPEPEEVNRVATSRTTLVLANEGAPGREVTVSFRLSTARGPHSSVEIRWPDGTTESVATSSVPATVERRVVLGGGDNRVDLSTNGPPLAGSGPDPVRMRIGNVWALDMTLLELARDGLRQAAASQ